MPDFVMAVAPFCLLPFFYLAEIIAARPNMLTLWGCPAQRCHMLPAQLCVRVCVSLHRCAYVCVCVEEENFAVGNLKSQNTFACK